MLLVQKIISNLFLSPMFMVIILIALSLYIYHSNLKKSVISKILVFIAFLFYLFSIEPSKDFFIKPLEKKYGPITRELLEQGEIYVLLGGGSYDNAPLSLRANGTPTETALARVVEAIRLYNINPKKIIISGGVVFSGKRSEADIYKTIMLDLGVEESNIILEEKSRTTGENAKYTKQILDKLGYSKIILITSASHMGRSFQSFKKQNLEIIPAPCNYTSNYSKYNVSSFMPRFSNLDILVRALWEYIGSIYYLIRNI